MPRIGRFACLALLIFAGVARGQEDELNPHVGLDTSMGRMIFELFPEEAPITVANFLGYVDSGFYEGLIFHRVVKDFVIQTGGYLPDLTTREPNAPIINESDNGLLNLRSTLAMARTTDPNSATSQFYVNLVDNPDLDYTEDKWGYAVFGQVVSGMDVVDAIGAVSVSTQSGMQNVPVEDIIINEAARVPLDLMVAEAPVDPVRVIPGETTDVTVVIKNIGTQTAVNSTDPNQPFIVSLYLADSADAAPDDPESELLGVYEVAAVAPLSAYRDTITFTAPNERGTFYLLPVVDDGNNVVEYEEDNNLGAAVTLEVEPNLPDLQIGDPNSPIVNAEPGATVDFVVKLVNDGAGDAVNSFDPNAPFWTSLYLSEDPCDPNTELWTLIADFSRTYLAGRSHTYETLTFTAPEISGEYYLYVLADDGNNVAEWIEDNNLSDPVKLVVAWEPNDVAFTRFTVLPTIGASGTAVIAGSFGPAPAAAQLDAADTVNIFIGPYHEALPRPSFIKLNAHTYYYRGQTGGVIFLWMDLQRETFQIMLHNADFAGLTAPVDFEIAFADYRGVAQPDADLLNGGRDLSLRFLQGSQDTLRVTNYVLTSDRAFVSGRDTLTFYGEIATAVAEPDLAGQKVDISWGNLSFSIPSGSSGLRQIGNRPIFIYQRLAGSTSKVAYALFNFETNTFSLFIREAASIGYPPQNLRLRFNVSDDKRFDKTFRVE